MKKLITKPTKCTPEIFFDPEKGVFNIFGDSYPENAYEFYNPVINWIDNFVKQKNQVDIELSIKIQYFDTSSSKCLSVILEKLEAYYKQGNKVNVNWLYNIDEEDNYSLQNVEELFIGLNLPYRFIKK